MIRNLWRLTDCKEIILNVMCDIKFATIENEIESFLAENHNITIVDNTQNCDSFVGYYIIKPLRKAVLHLRFVYVVDDRAR